MNSYKITKTVSMTYVCKIWISNRICKYFAFGMPIFLHSVIMPQLYYHFSLFICNSNQFLFSLNVITLYIYGIHVFKFIYVHFLTSLPVTKMLLDANMILNMNVNLGKWIIWQYLIIKYVCVEVCVIFLQMQRQNRNNFDNSCNSENSFMNQQRSLNPSWKINLRMMRSHWTI